MANFQEAKRAFYKDARKALDQSRANRGFYPNQPKRKGKSQSKGKNDAAKVAFHGKCMRCGKYGHKAQFCPQSAGKDRQAGKGSGVGFVFSSWTNPCKSPEPAFMVDAEAKETKAVLDCGASESIIGAWTLQGYSDDLRRLGFNPEKEISIDHRLRKTFIFGNNESSQALGLARMTTGIHGRETETEAHVVEGQTPLLLSSRWIHDQRAVVDFGTGQAVFPKLSQEVVQLERAPTYHLLLPITAFFGHEKAKELTRVKEEDVSCPLLRACAQEAAGAGSQADSE